jgi:alcohol dehydrogenase class IV
MPTFKTIDKLITGADCFEQLGELAAGLGRRALIVTGRNAMRKAGVTDRACELLAAAGVEARLFEEIAGEPTTDEVDAGRALCREEHCDLVIGLGGGSAMDAAKAVAALVHADAPTTEYVESRSADAETTLPCIAIPSTSGTGTEVTPNAVISVSGKPLKKSIRGNGVLPAVALVDPKLVLSCPPDVTAASGMDALTQAIEAYVSIHATPITDAVSFKAARLLLASLPAAVESGDDLAAREACSYGSVLAGMALANARLGVVHGIAHPLGVRYHIPHGLCCAALLPASIRLNREAAKDKYAMLSHVAGGEPEEIVNQMLDRFGIGRTLAAQNIPESDFAVIAAESMPSGSLKANPKTVTEDDVIRILREVTG